jgi:hypothetical protein
MPDKDGKHGRGFDSLISPPCSTVRQTWSFIIPSSVGMTVAEKGPKTTMQETNVRQSNMKMEMPPVGLR